MSFLDENKILTTQGIIELVDNKLIRFQVHNHVTKPKLEYLQEVIDAYSFLCKGNKYPLLMIANKVDKLDPEEEKVIRETTPKFFTSQAIVTVNPLTVMVINLALSIMKPSVPTKVFSTEEKALTWLEQFMD